MRRYRYSQEKLRSGDGATDSPTQDAAVRSTSVDNAPGNAASGGHAIQQIDDVVAVEEPLEIRLEGRRFTTTMRTPGADHQLALGLLLTEGIIHSLADVAELRTTTRCRELNLELVNVVDVQLHEMPQLPQANWERALISNTSCGLCGKASVDALEARIPPRKAAPGPAPQVLLQLPERLRNCQPLFASTGGLHAAGLFTAKGELLACFEDIGRHNATDKVLGQALKSGLLSAPASLTLLVSGRASYEIVQKALMAGIGTVVAVSAPSNLAVELAQTYSLNLVGFLRPAGFTLYSGSLNG